MRRTFRRHIRKTLAQDVPPILQEANFAFDKGEYGRAGELFERMAETASARGGSRAPLFYLQAGRARVLAGQTALGIPSIKRGLELLLQHRRFPRLRRAAQRVLSELNERGLRHEVSEIEAWLDQVSTSDSSTEASQTLPQKPVLPTYCPACGAVVHPDELEWLDEATAECEYCGSPLR
ncbi:MAG TPA: hypothetical protein VK897_21630 [Anaerolineales bacterium]|nr:hypothetical protein [Anaerolineales bacterium]